MSIMIHTIKKEIIYKEVDNMSYELLGVSGRGRSPLV